MSCSTDLIMTMDVKMGVMDTTPLSYRQCTRNVQRKAIANVFIIFAFFAAKFRVFSG